MSLIITHDACPACGSTRIRKVLTAKDFTVSQQKFEIWQCEACTGRFTQNIPDQSSIGKFYQSENYISHSNTNMGIINQIYHRVRKFTLRSKRRLVQSFTHLSSGNILDVGAGTGAFINCMQQAGWQVEGLEPDESARQIAQQVNGILLRPANDIFRLLENNFDAITLWHVLEHVHQLHQIIDQLKKILRPSGLIFLAVPNYTSFDAAHYKEYWAAYDVPRHLYHFSPHSMQWLMEKHGLKIIAIKPMWFDSIYVSLLSEKYKTGKTNLLKGFWNGMMSNSIALQNKQRCSSLVYIISK